MLRRPLKKNHSTLLVLLLAVWVSGDLVGQTGAVQTRHLADSVYLITTTDTSGSRTNSLLSIGRDGTVLVDHPGDWRTLRANPSTVVALQEAWHALRADDPKLIINTHWHGDHTAGNLAYANAHVVAHQNVRTRLAARQTPWWFPDGIGPMPERGWPDMTFVDSMTLFENDQIIRLWNFGPAHTDGDAVVYFEKAQVVHMGDLYHGLADPSVGEDMLGLLTTLEHVEQRVADVTHVVPGHGAVTSVEELRRYIAMLDDTINWVEDAVHQQATLSQVQERGIPEPWRGTVADPDAVAAWLQEIYRTLTEVER